MARSTGARSPFVLTCVLAGAGCRPEPATRPPEPTPQAGPTTPAKARARAPEDVVATVDGEEIREADVAARLEAVSSEEQPVSRAEVVLQLVERRLVAREAERRGVTVGEPEIDGVLQAVATQYGLSPEQLRAAVEETTGLSWEEYRREIAVELLETKLVLAALPRTTPAAWDVPSPAQDSARVTATGARVMGCLRAQAKVEVKDAAVVLPENPFAAEASLGAVRFVGDPVLPAAELEAVAKLAVAGRPLCESLDTAENAITQIYLERGYLEARVTIPWPAAPKAGMTVDVEVEPGLRHVIGELRLDQSAVVRSKRAKEKAVLREVAAVAKAGDVATPASLEAIGTAVRTAMLAAGIEDVETSAARVAQGEDMRVDLVFRATGPAPGKPVVTKGELDLEFERIGGIRLRMPAADVVAVLGEPASKSKIVLEGATGDYVQRWEYPAQDLVIAMGATTRKGKQTVKSITAGPKCPLPASWGLRIGSTRDEVKKVYGRHHDPVFTNEDELVAGSIYWGAMYTFEDGKVARIFIGAAAE